MLYDHEIDLRSTEERIKRSSISEENKRLIFEFESYCFAQGLKIARVLKHLTELKVWTEMLGKDFKAATKSDVMKLVEYIERSDRAARTKEDYKVLIRKFFRWLEKGDVVDWMQISAKKDSRKLPEDMLSEEEIEKMINACAHPRDKALVACLYESGARISELGDMKIKHAGFDPNGAVLMLDGKTGMRRVRIISSAPYLAAWLDNHPFKDDREKSVWVGIGTVSRNEPMKYDAIRFQLKDIGKRAGIKKRIYPHLFRHSRSTHLAKYLTEAQMKQYLGWVQGSSMAAIYVHLSGRDVDNALLKMHGMAPEETREVKMSPKKCVRCSTMNAPTSKFCCRCHAALDLSAAIDFDKERNAVMVELFDLMSKDPSIMDLLKRQMAKNAGIDSSALSISHQ